MSFLPGQARMRRAPTKRYSYLPYLSVLVQLYVRYSRWRTHAYSYLLQRAGGAPVLVLVNRSVGAARILPMSRACALQTVDPLPPVQLQGAQSGSTRDGRTGAPTEGPGRNSNHGEIWVAMTLRRRY